MRNVRLLLVLVVALMIIVGSGVLVPALMNRVSPAVNRPEALGASPGAEALPVPADVTRLSAAFRTAVKRVGPAVVAVGTSQTIEAPASPFGFHDDILRRFFGIEPEEGHTPKRQYERQGLGSGVIVDSEGYILTNNHVVAGADEITIRLADEREFKAEIIGADPPTDVAVIKIKADGLPVAPLGDSDKMEVGDWVLAIGAPFGLQKTVTAGIISAKGRANVGIADYEDFIQTDAAINPGNSGGPLVNMRGEVIGINTAIASRSGGYMGIGFAVPANMAREIMTRLKEKGEVVRGWLGVQIGDLNGEMAEAMGLESAEGALVSQVFEDGPAAKGGLRAGDVVVEYDGKPVKDMAALKEAVAWTEPGSEVKVAVLRKGERETLTVEIGRRSGQPEAALGQPNGPAAIEDLGIEVSDVTPEAAQRFGYKEGQGVLITGVEPGSLGARARLRPGMLILQVGDRKVHSVSAFRDALKEVDLSRGVLMLVRAGNSQTFVLIKKR
ncbi:MAG: DegQ family serine endoprotease [Phycisphaerae bacterium]